MPQPVLLQLNVLDLVPFGRDPEHQTAFYALRLTPPDWEHWSPGQFVMLRPAACGQEVLWGRPFAICSLTNRDLVIFFQVRGRATSLLAQMQPGATLNVWGPLGNAFAVEEKTPTLLLAGGIGIAPFVGYVQTHPAPWDLRMEFGHRMPLECYPFDSIGEKAMAESHVEKTPADREKFLALVERRIKEFAGGGLVLACGPTPFLLAVQALSRKYEARTQLSLETRMACGIGACLGCVVKAKTPAGQADAERHNVQTCTCGPNFWADSVTFG